MALRVFWKACLKLSLVTCPLTPIALRKRDGNRRLVDIQPDENAILHSVSPQFLMVWMPPDGIAMCQDGDAEAIIAGGGIHG
ncbi:hypothetical protein ACEUZ9_004592 [Paracoccus litorisediminis]|uniref:hypothetical protein n=1 Tax=Paracoccus litorisediminis TaxID=2006130 RepID=UPI0037305105